MIIYESTKDLFVKDVDEDLISQKIYLMYQQKIGKTTIKEIKSWDNSLLHMYRVLNTVSIPDKAGIAIEYRLPAMSKRIDFMITGEDELEKENVIIIELKQWETMKRVEEKDNLVMAPLGGGLHEKAHPSYQAWSYAAIIKEYNETVQREYIKLHPCSYLHNYMSQGEDSVLDESFYPLISESPVFKKGDVIKMREFISRYVKKPDRTKIIYKIEYGKIKPSKSLQDALSGMLHGNREFIMIDTQKVIYENAIIKARQACQTGQKEVLIIEGGPGTGKSVLAINLLVKLTSEELVCQYVSKNSAPRDVYRMKLQGDNYKNKYIDCLFKGSGIFYEAQKNDIDVLVVDEAHRLNEKSGIFKNKGENQAKEIINAAKCSIFFIDENQKVTASDVGSVNEIVKFAKEAGANITSMKLDSQFRCNGSEGYLSWLEDVLEIRSTANDIGFEGDYTFEIIDDPNKLYNKILEKNKINNKARLVAGYCWEWCKEGKSNSDIHDIVIPEFGFEMSWNLNANTPWAIDANSVNQIGCIHTCQGLEFDYVGVIIGNDMRYENGKVVTDFTKRASSDKSLNGIKGYCKKGDESALKEADKIIRNTYRTLMTRGQKGCYVFCQDKKLADYLKSRMEQSLRNSEAAAALESKK